MFSDYSFGSSPWKTSGSPSVIDRHGQCKHWQNADNTFTSICEVCAFPINYYVVVKLTLKPACVLNHITQQDLSAHIGPLRYISLHVTTIIWAYLCTKIPLISFQSRISLGSKSLTGFISRPHYPNFPFYLLNSNVVSLLTERAKQEHVWLRVHEKWWRGWSFLLSNPTQLSHYIYHLYWVWFCWKCVKCLGTCC